MLIYKYKGIIGVGYVYKDNVEFRFKRLLNIIVLF